MKTLRLLLDQMLDEDVAKALLDLHYDVVRVQEYGLATADDAEILAYAVKHSQVLVTLDEHFGDWVVLPLSKHHGVIRIKATPTTSQSILAILLPFLAEHARRNFANSLVIVKETGCRWISTHP